MLSMRTRVSAVARTDAVFKAYDIRGTYPDQIDGTLIRALGAAVAKHCAVPTLLVARDMRASGVELTAAFAEGAATQGVGIIDLGMASTDFLYFAAGHLNAPGAMFTASHNPAQYNGVKLCYAGARPIGQDTGLAEIQALTEGFLASPPPHAIPDVSERDLLGEWVKHVHSFIDVGALRPLKIIADTANGMGGLVVPLVMAGLPFEVEILYPELDGTFPNHPADPIQPENLVALQQAVLERGADIGLAFDGDADRVFLVDEHAEGVSGSLTTAMVADAMLTKHPGATILYNLICSKVVPEVVEAQGGTAVKTRVGHSFIKAEMQRTSAIFGGEHSGHYYYRDNFNADSGIITAMVVLELMGTTGKSLSELALPYARYSASGEINTEVPSPSAAVAAVAAHLQGTNAILDHLDGLTATYDDWWFNLRPSNTEPLLRLNLEAPTPEMVSLHVKEVQEMIRTLLSNPN